MFRGRADHLGPPVPPARPVVRRGKVMLCGSMQDGRFVPRRHVVVREREKSFFRRYPQVGIREGVPCDRECSMTRAGGKCKQVAGHRSRLAIPAVLLQYRRRRQHDTSL